MRSMLRGRRAVPSAAVAGLLAVASGCAGTARAQDATAAQAQSLQSQVRTALVGLLGPQIPLGEHPVRIAAQGDHFVVAVPFAGPLGTSGVSIKGPALTAALRPLDHGRWALSDILLPAPMTITVPPDKTGHPGVWTLTMQAQDQHAVFDPTGATPSTWDGTIKGYATDWRKGAVHEQSHAETIKSHAVWQPTGNGRGDFIETQVAEHLSSAFILPNVGPVGLTAERAGVKAHVDALDLNALASLVRAGLDLAPAAAEAAKAARSEHDGAPKSFTPPNLTQQQRKTVQTALTATEGLMSGFGEAVALEHVAVQAGGVNATLQSLRFGLAFSAPHGKMRLQLILGFDGLDSPSLPPQMRAYLPRHFSIAPEVHGIPATQLAALMNRAVAHPPGEHPAPDALKTLLDKGPITFAIDEMSLALGPATVKATGDVSVSKPEAVDGKALVTATGLDALIQQAGADPMLKDAEPVLLMLKGLGTADGTKTIWNVTYVGGKVLVNGHDLSGLMPKKS